MPKMSDEAWHEGVGALEALAEIGKPKGFTLGGCAKAYGFLPELRRVERKIERCFCQWAEASRESHVNGEVRRTYLRRNGRGFVPGSVALTFPVLVRPGEIITASFVLWRGRKSRTIRTQFPIETVPRRILRGTV